MAVKQYTCYLTYYQIAKLLPTKEQQGEFWVAVNEYMFADNDIEADLHPFTAMAFINAKSHLKTSLRNSENSKKKSTSNRLQNEIETTFERLSNETEATNQQSKDKAKTKTKDKEQYSDSFAWQCLKVSNEELGQTYAILPPSVVNHLNTLHEIRSVSVEQVRTMIRYKRDEWLGTRWQRHLNPNTLFSVEHFEQYLEQSRGGEDDGEVKRLAEEFDF